MNQTRQCYYPDGTSDDHNTPCAENDDESHCCGPQDFCLNNGHCLQATDNEFANRIGRGTCTDSSWMSSACPNECSDVAPDGDCSVFLAYDTGNGAFCCGLPYDTDTQQCPIASGPSGNNPFDMTAGRIIWNRTDGSYMQSGSLQPSEIQLSRAERTITVTLSSTGGTAPAAVTPSDAATCDVTPVAAGIAVPLAVLLLAAVATIAFLAFQLRRLKKQRSNDPSRLGPTNGAPYDQAGSQQWRYSSTPMSASHSPLPNHGTQYPQQYQQQQVWEAPVRKPMVEADGIRPPQELGVEGQK